MEAKPLETIPKETDAPATPERVTSDVPKTKPATAKNPGRVASGTRVAERNRLAREAKKQAEAQKPPTNSATNTTEQSSSSSTNTVYFILGIGGLIVSGLGVYYQREAIMRTLGRSQKTEAESNTTTVDVVDPPSPKPKVKCEIIRMKQFQNLIYTHTMKNTEALLYLMGLVSFTYMWLDIDYRYFSTIAD